ncbi:HAD family hydrolase [Lentilitoribacter sp. Alg239-R112]|uniref:HAD family hydrolase n=1 Tax=Lentilitoribacter sp. Alg239-R112 TaxID=2305987 RepID=UPI0013A6E061|nr:HAD family hydrolase [Lentilitoribacter sp. Alg239-R112]
MQKVSVGPSLSKALFLDRDGVVNIDTGYVHRQEDFEFVDGIFELVNKAHHLGFLIIIITNQAGIGRGYYSEQQFKDLSAWMCQCFLDKSSPLTRVYHSPFHPTKGLGKYRQDHITRKPRPGMILQATIDYQIALEASILIGDKMTDIEAGITAGVGRNILFDPEPNPAPSERDFEIISSIRSALPLLVSINHENTI